MSTASTCLPAVIPTHRSPLQAALEQLREWADRFSVLLRGRSEAALSSLPDGLDAALLRDIGFAAWQVEQRELQRIREIERWLW